MNFFGVTFNFPSVEDKEKNAIMPQGQTIPVPQDMYDSVAFIGWGHDGKHPGTWTLHYSDGATEEAESQIPEWCTPPPEGARWVLNCPYRYIQGGPASPPCMMFYWEIPVDPTRNLKSVELPTFKNAYIHAITAIKK